MNGVETSLQEYAGKVCLVVNVASKCGFTKDNYEQLEALYQKYKDRGFVVLAFPCNQFNKQEPGTEDEIKEFVKSKFGVTFPVFAKIDVNGESAHPLYQFLKDRATGLLGGGIKWNFTKFLCDKNGVPVKRYAPQTLPSEIEKDIILLLPKSDVLEKKS